jgi:hypothetical protein
MSVRARLGLVVMWVASLAAVAALAKAQAQVSPMIKLAAPIVLSGNDVGFRVEGRVGNTPAGTLVIRVNGDWIVPRDASGGATRPAWSQ